MTDTVELAAEGATATLSLVGAEPLSWRVGGRESLWHGDPAHWSFRAPILFPRVGASAGGTVTVAGRDYPMAQHGFARAMPFRLVSRAEDRATLRLTDGDDTRARYPFAFTLDVEAVLGPDTLSLLFAVENGGDAPMPYALGFHPAFPWPLSGTTRDGHGVVFGAEERPNVPEVAAGGLLARTTRPVPLAGRALPLAPELFSEALVFLDARSRALAFEAPDGDAVEMAVEDFPHLAVWSRPTAPFLSLECWTGHADWVDTSGELEARPSMRLLAPGAVARHGVSMRRRPAPA